MMLNQDNETISAFIDDPKDFKIKIDHTIRDFDNLVNQLVSHNYFHIFR